ncbi:MAG: hypothetical protein MJ084_03585 [Saccharofermentans sp.]|nr:hypothetical protein [Saccharofermentans sp.]
MNDRHFKGKTSACFTSLLVSASLLFCSCTVIPKEPGNTSETAETTAPAAVVTTGPSETNTSPIPYGLGTTLHINGFDITFEGLTGELCSPQLQFSIRTNDELFCSLNTTFDLTVYPAIDEQQYDSRSDSKTGSAAEQSNNCLYKTVTATQDVHDPHLYTAWIIAKPNAMSDGQTFVVGVRSIRTGVEIAKNADGTIDRLFDEEIILNAEWKITFAKFDESVIRNSRMVNMKDGRYNDISGKGDYDITANEVSFFIYSTEVFLDFKWLKGKESFLDNSDKIERDILKITGEPKLIVDGVEYNCTIDAFLVWMSPGEYPGIVFTFPSIYYEKAQSIVLTCGGSEITVK